MIKIALVHCKQVYNSRYFLDFYLTAASLLRQMRKSRLREMSNFPSSPG